jgi:long-chain fatty acid transport protein
MTMSGRFARLAFLAWLVSFSATANNGLNLTGYGAESSAMGGADVAVARDSLAINTNPAGLGQIRGKAFDFYVSPFLDWNGHADQYGNDATVSQRAGAILGAGYAQRLRPSLVAGAGLFVQGGIGFHYPELQTAFGTRDEISSRFSVIKLAPGLAWQLDDRLSLGLNAGLVYVALSESLFPNTSVVNAQDPAASFFGLRLQGGKGYSWSGRGGLQYRLSDRLTLALSYAGKTLLPISGASLALDETAAGNGTVTYRRSSVKGLALPQEAAAGLAWAPSAQWLLSFELKWLDWSGAVRTLTVEGRDPDRSNVPATLQLPSQMNFRDQYVTAGGLAYRLDDRTVLRAGINYARRAVPGEDLNPVFATINSRHYMLGFGRQVSSRWQFAGAVEYMPREEVSYTNPALPFGQDARERTEAVFLHLMISGRWP